MLFGLKITIACKIKPKLVELEKYNKILLEKDPVKYKRIHCINTITPAELSTPIKNIGIARSIEYRGGPKVKGSLPCRN
jgi:hypothetical protein